MHLPFVNLGAKSQPNSFDAYHFENTLFAAYFSQAFVNSPESSTIQTVNFAMLCVTSETIVRSIGFGRALFQ